MLKRLRVVIGLFLLVSVILYTKLQFEDTSSLDDNAPKHNAAEKPDHLGFKSELIESDTSGKQVLVTDIVFFTIAYKGEILGNVFIGLFGTREPGRFSLILFE